MEHNAVILNVSGLVAGYGENTILNGTTFSVHERALTTIIGPNGAGKSTLFKALFGLLPLRAGKVVMHGEDITGLPPLKLLQHGVAYVPQGRNIFPELTVEHNLEFGGASLGDLQETRRRMALVMDQFPVLREKAKAQASTLSGAEAQASPDRRTVDWPVAHPGTTDIRASTRPAR